MDRTGKALVTAKVRFEARERLTAELEWQRARRRELSGGEPWRTAGLPRREAAGVRAGWRRELGRLREAGELLDTVDVLAVWGIRAELEARGWWERRWPAVPDEAMDPGRWPGSRDGGFEKAVPLRLPQPLARRVYAACWHTSSASIEALRDWRDRNPDAVPRRRWSSLEELEDPLREYVRLAGGVTTVGEVWRGGLDRGIEAAAVLRTRSAAD